jgi:uncharacterized repeat protein (TIGR03803 family)
MSAALAIVASAFLFPVTAQAAKVRVLYSFNGSSDGGFPEGELFRDSAGNLYGTNEAGGSTDCGGGGCGTVFKVTRPGHGKILHTFNGDDGAFPIASLTGDTAGNFYGTTYNGGAHIAGTVFKIAPDGQWTSLYSFKGGSDGANPFAGLVADGKGNFFGTTAKGGTSNKGTVYKITPSGKETTIYSFAGGTDGVYPIGALLRDSAGNFYGTASNGGVDCDGTGFGCGIVFKVTPQGQETVLYRFEGGSHGANPAAGVVMDETGALYGTTNGGGIVCDGSGATCGTVYKLTSGGQETGLHVFQGGVDGSYPKSLLLLGTDGFFYGTTAEGGPGTGECGCGTVFRMTRGGREKILHTFSGSDGHGPFGGVITDGAGHLFGTTNVGGEFSYGTVYKLKIRQH